MVLKNVNEVLIEVFEVTVFADILTIEQLCWNILDEHDPLAVLLCRLIDLRGEIHSSVQDQNGVFDVSMMILENMFDEVHAKVSNETLILDLTADL